MSKLEATSCSHSAQWRSSARSWRNASVASISAGRTKWSASDGFVTAGGAKTNARNFKNWRYGPQPDCGLPATADIISRAFDVRLPLLFEEEDFDVMIEIVSECLDNVRNGVFVVDEAPVAFAR